MPVDKKKKEPVKPKKKAPEKKKAPAQKQKQRQTQTVNINLGGAKAAKPRKPASSKPKPGPGPAAIPHIYAPQSQASSTPIDYYRIGDIVKQLIPPVMKPALPVELSAMPSMPKPKLQRENSSQSDVSFAETEALYNEAPMPTPMMGDTIRAPVRTTIRVPISGLTNTQLNRLPVQTEGDDLTQQIDTTQAIIDERRRRREQKEKANMKETL